MTIEPTLRRLIAAAAISLSVSSGLAQDATRSLVVIDVPFMAQGVDLCGGAAAAMVLRYWGGDDVQPEDFSSLVDHSKGGISTADLVGALAARGVTPRAIRAEAEDLTAEVRSGRPVIALIDGGGGRLHYVVIVGWTNDHVLFHDPSVGPFQVRSRAEFQERWKVTDGFALLITPEPEIVGPRKPTPVSEPSAMRGSCDALGDPAIVVARGADPEAAVPALNAAAELCPGEARAVAALAGVRFRQERWEESARYARLALARERALGSPQPEGSEDTWRLLGAALYLDDQAEAALSAWNQVEEPRIDRIQIEGLRRTRQDLATAVVGLRGRDVLSPRSLNIAERRLQDMPTFPNARITYRATSGGRADIVVNAAEARLTEPWIFLLARLTAKGVARRELSLRLNSPTGRGESVSLGGRFAAHRPAVWASIDTPLLAGLPGVVSIGGLWDRQTYRLDGTSAGPLAIETRRRGSALWGHWLSERVRIEAGLAVDRFEHGGSFVSPRVGGEFRLAEGRVALLSDLSWWAALGDQPGFSEGGAALALRSATRPRRLAVTARAEGRRATQSAPLALWPGAGTGQGRSLLQRATPLLEDEEVIGDAFGRGLLHATVEAEVKIADRGPARLGLAAFFDWSRPWDTTRSAGSGSDIWAIGFGLRVRGLSNSALRIDVAVRPGRRDLILSAGVIPRWPR